MNKLSSRQRKMLYFAGILVLLFPVIKLGMPAGDIDERGKPVGGGILSQIRHDPAYDLGETSLGNVDPASSTMTLVLLGFRGVAANILWLEAQENQKNKNWAQLRANVDSIVLLQPHFINVWNFQGWNLSYNVSAQWDAVPDRYYWVKEGAKFVMKGTQRNRKNPELYWWTGRILGHKIGLSDEWRYFRKYYKYDPDSEGFYHNLKTGEFHGSPDPEMSRFANQDFDDNYLAAKYWYRTANEREKAQEQHIQMRMIFRHFPVRSQLDYADALQREGLFDEVTQEAWAEAHRDLTERYVNGDTAFGLEIFWRVPVGGDIFLEADTPAELQELVDSDRESGKGEYTLEMKRQYVISYQNIVNYRYWRTRAKAESEGVMKDAHRYIYEGKQLYNEAKNTQARKRIIEGMKKFEDLLKDYPDLLVDDSTIEECLLAYMYLQSIYQLEQEPMPTDLPLMRAQPRPDRPAESLIQRENNRLPGLISTFKRESQAQ